MIVEANDINKGELKSYIDVMFTEWLDKSSFGASNTCCPNRTKNEVMERLDGKSEISYRFFSSFDENGSINGFLCANFNEKKRTVELEYINVSPDVRGKYVFRNMLDEVCRIAVVNGFEKVILDTWKENDAAMAAFEKTGFKNVSEGCDCCSVKFEKLLTGQGV